MLELALARAYPVALWLLLAAWLWSAYRAAPGARKLLAPALGGKGGAALAGIALLALAARLLAPHGHRVFFDEYEHLDVALNLAAGRGWTETLARLPGVDVVTPPTWPGLYHAALAPLLGVFGGSAAAAFNWTALFGALACLAAGLAAAAAFGTPAAAAVAAGLVAALPEHLLFSTNCDLTAFSTLWVALSILAVELAARARSRESLVFAALTLACAAHARYENGALVLLAAPRLWAAARGARDRAWLAAPALALAATGALVLRNRGLAIPGFDEPAGSAFSNLARNLPANAEYLFFPPAGWLVLLPALVLAARAARAGEGRAALKLCAFTALAYLAVYSSFYRGAFALGSEARYAAAVFLPLAIAAAGGLGARPRWAAGALALFTALSWTRYGAPVEPAHAAEAALLDRAAAKLPEGEPVVALAPSAVAAGARRPVVAARLLIEDPEGWKARLGAGPVWVLEDFWPRRRGADWARTLSILEAGRAEDAERRLSVPVAGSEYAFRRLVYRSSSSTASRRRLSRP